MSATASAAELERAYEALRAQATGALPTITPRGLALLRRSGLAAWMAACPAPPPCPSRDTGDDPRPTPLAALGAELVSVLTEMALSGQRAATA